MMFRKAAKDDFGDVTALYEKAHDEEEAGLIHTGWQRGVYPTAETVRAALDRDDLFVAEQDGNAEQIVHRRRDQKCRNHRPVRAETRPDESGKCRDVDHCRRRADRGHCAVGYSD